MTATDTTTLEGTPRVLRFGAFELDATREELRKRGVAVKLQAQPLKVLELLAARSGELVSRRQIQEHVWGAETFVDFEQGINVCIRQIRQALGDSAGSPRFVETVPRRGYRFLAPVEQPPAVVPPPAPRRRRPWILAAAATALAAGALVVSAWMLATEPQGAGATGGSLLLVLPFENYSAEASADYLSDGLTEELITEISRRYGGRLGVIARTSTMKYKETSQSIAEIAAELGVDYVLEGSVRRQGDRVRVTAQLIRAAGETHIWAGNYDRDFADVLALETEVSEKIGQALALKLRLLPTGQPPTTAVTPAAAHEAYLKGHFELNRQALTIPASRDLLESAQSHLERALRIDPGFAPAYLDLATVYRSLPGSHEGARRARESLERALALDDLLAPAHLQMAKLRFYYDWDLEGARQSFERALEIDPGFAQAYHDFAAYFSVTGRHRQAVASVEQALRLDPLSPAVASDVGWYFYFGRRYSEAVEHCRRTLEMAPGYHWAEECLLLAATAGGDLDTAVEQARRDMQKVAASDAALARLDEADAGKALDAYWRWRLARLQATAERGRVPAVMFADVHMALGDGDAAIDSLELAVEERAGWTLPFLPVHPLFDPLRSDPRFVAVLERIASGAPAQDPG